MARNRYREDKETRRRAQKKRGALSLEDLPLEVYREEELPPRVKVPRTWLRVAAILLVCVVGMLCFVYRDYLSPERVSGWVQDTLLGMGSGSGYPTPIVGSEVLASNFQLMDKDLAVVSDTSFVSLNRTAKELANRQHSFGNPVLKVAGGNALIYNQGGSTLQVETRSQTVLKRDKENTLEQRILAADISDDGIYAVLTEASGYFSEMTVYPKTIASDKPDEYLYRYWFSDYYMNAIALNAQGRQAAVGGLNANNGQMESALYLFDFSSGTLETKPADFLFPDMVILDMSFLSNGNIAVVCDQQLSIINPATKEKVDYPYNQRTLSCFSINKGSGVTLALSKSNDGRACDVVYVDTSGAVKTEVSTPYKVISVAQNGDTLALLSGGYVYLYSTAGEPISENEAGLDARKVLLPTADEAYILGISEIRSIFLTK